jgi:hypothetical protein
VALFERQKIRQFAPVPPDDEPTPSLYVQTMQNGATVSGYEPQGVFVMKRGMRDVCAWLYLSPERDTLAQVGGGKIASMEYKKTVLFSRLADGRILASADNAGEGDISGTIAFRFLTDANFPELVGFHQRRVAEAGEAVVAWSDRDIQKQWESIDVAKAEAMERRGYGRFVDPQRNTFSYTFKGAAMLVVKSVLPQIVQGAAQIDRV